jgi:GMP synthase-like glutamine amidotransferase
MKIGILETGEVNEALRDEHGNYTLMFEALLKASDQNLTFHTVSVVNGALPSSPLDADGWIITGSRHGVYDDLPWIAPFKEFLCACVAAGVPLVGVCFGHQILAEALGGKVEKSAKGWGVGVHKYDVVRKPGWMKDASDSFSVRALHQDQIVTLPPQATVLASSDFCEYAALAYGNPEAPFAISVQPHPEFSADYVDAIVEMRRGTAIPPATADAAKESLAQPVHSTLWADWMVDFLRAAANRRKAA